MTEAKEKRSETESGHRDPILVAQTMRRHQEMPQMTSSKVEQPAQLANSSDATMTLKLLVMGEGLTRKMRLSQLRPMRQRQRQAQKPQSKMKEVVMMMGEKEELKTK